METNPQPTGQGVRKAGVWRYWTVALVCGLGLLANPTLGQSDRSAADTPYPGTLKPAVPAADPQPAAITPAPSAPTPTPEPQAAQPARSPAAPVSAQAPGTPKPKAGVSVAKPAARPQPAAPALKPSSAPQPAASPSPTLAPKPTPVPKTASAAKPAPVVQPVSAPKPAPAPRPALAVSVAPVAPAPAAPKATPAVVPSSPRLVVEQEAEQVFQRVADKKLYSFRAMNTEIKTALALFARANNLNIVPDSDVSGNITLDVRDLPLEQLMRAILEANDFTWDEEEGLIRVRATKTETFKVDYLRLSRNGQGQNSASLSAASSGSGRGGSGGGGGGGGGSGGGGRGSRGGSSINVTAQNEIDFWKELQTEIAKLLTAEGKQTLAVNMTAGMIQVTDRPSALKRVSRYLEGAMDGVRRQVDLEAKLYDVLLNNEYQLGIDWEMAARAGTGMVTGGGSTIVTAPLGGFTPSGSTLNLTFQNDDVTVILQALQQQGEVTVISKPRIRTLNNQTALIKVGTETPFFSQRSTIVPGVNSVGSTVLQDDQVTTITVGTILSITPQISDDGWVTLDISPVLTSLVGVELSPTETTTAPVLDIKQASTLVRVKDGSTIVMGGLIQDSKSRTVRKIPIVGDIPILGKLFQGRYDASQKKELVIFITPRIVRDGL